MANFNLKLGRHICWYALLEMLYRLTDGGLHQTEEKHCDLHGGIVCACVWNWMDAATMFSDMTLLFENVNLTKNLSKIIMRIKHSALYNENKLHTWYSFLFFQLKISFYIWNEMFRVNERYKVVHFDYINCCIIGNILLLKNTSCIKQT